MKRIEAIKTFFEQDGGRKVTMDELKALSTDSRQELGVLSAQALGVELEEPVSSQQAA